jgi:adenine deaminase
MVFSSSSILPRSLWKLATWEPGDRLGIDGLGRVETGAPADILLFRRDPTQDLDNLASLDAVVSAGRLYRIDDLRTAMQSNTAYFSSPLIKPLARRGAEQALKRAFARPRS